MAPTYSEVDQNLMRLRCIHAKVTTKVLHFVFARSSSDRPHTMSLTDYYTTKGAEPSKFKKGMYSRQLQRIATDPGGNSFDITLLYACLRKGCHSLAPENDNKWTEGNGCLESLITTVKNKRNYIAHEEPAFNHQELLQEVQEVGNILRGILTMAGHHYHLFSSTINQEITNVDLSITKYMNDELTSQDFEDYKKQLRFPAQSEYVNKEGKEEVLSLYDRSCEGEVTTVNHLMDTSFPVNTIYTDMVLKSESPTGEKTIITFDNVLAGEGQAKTDSVILINGDAGIGKTTLIKKIISDWRSNHSTMKHLTDFDHLLKAECRNTVVKSFDELLHHFMPEVSRYFKHGDLQKVMLAQSILVVIDGLDELNEASAMLFKDVLHLHKVFGITVIITTRPEKFKYLEYHVKSSKVKLKHIQLLGVPLEKRDELVTKYHTEIAKKQPVTRNIEGLLEYLNRTQHRLSDLWRLPYNLTLLTIIWAYNQISVTSIDTAPQLYQEIYRLYRSKLKDRLQSYKTTSHLSESERERIIDSFIFSLAKESLIGLKNNHINLQQEGYEKLKNTCSYMTVPIEEMISAFLNKIPGSDIVYGFPHKGLQDFLAAIYIWMEITGKSKSYNVQKVLEGFNAVLIQNGVPASAIHRILKMKESELKDQSQKTANAGGFLGSVQCMIHGPPGLSMIKNILYDIHGHKSFDMSKFQNMMISLIGMFYLEGNKIQDSIKQEAMKLLQETGVRDRDAWISILNSVKCDEYVATFISKQPKILKGHIQITDSSVSAYISLMQALKHPLKNAEKLRIDIDIQEELGQSSEVLQLIALHQFQVNRIQITDDNYQEYVSILKNLKMPLKATNKVNVDIHVDEDLLKLKDLLQEIRKKNFKIRKLEIKDKIATSTIVINDHQLLEYTKYLKLLPQVVKGVWKTIFKIRISEKINEASELLEEISRSQLTVYVNILHDFRHPMSHSNLGVATNKVFKRCRVMSYLGALTPDLKIPKSVRWLALSVSGSNANLLAPFLKSRSNLCYLGVCLPVQVNDSVLKPLPSQRQKLQPLLAPDVTLNTPIPPMLFLLDILDTQQHIKKAAVISQRLQPVTGQKCFYSLYFPRCRLQTEGIRDLLQQLNVQIMMHVVFPSSCRPVSDIEENSLKGIAKRKLGCRFGILWGKAGRGLFNLDTWNTRPSVMTVTPSTLQEGQQVNKTEKINIVEMDSVGKMAFS